MENMSEQPKEEEEFSENLCRIKQYADRILDPVINLEFGDLNFYPPFEELSKNISNLIPQWRAGQIGQEGIQAMLESIFSYLLAKEDQIEGEKEKGRYKHIIRSMIEEFKSIGFF